MAKQDLATYWQELAANGGLSEDESKAVAEALGNDKVKGVFGKAFVREPDYQAGLNKQREEWQGKVDVAAAESGKWKKWYEEEAKPAYDKNVAGIQSLEQYQALYGPLDGTGDPPEKKTELPANVVTQEKLDEMLQQRDQSTVQLMKTAVTIGADHLTRFKEPLPVDEVEKIAMENRIPLDQAYQQFIAPRVKEAETADWEKKIDAAKEEGARDALSQHKLPTNPTPSTPHPFFSEREKVPETEQDQRVESKNAFFAGWNKEGAA